MAAEAEPERSGLVLLLATRNRKKRLEIERILGGASATALQLVDLDLYPDLATAPEEGATFAENARQKARWYAAATGQLCVADDSGLEVDALGGAPGVHSARFAGPAASDADNRRKLLAELARLPGAPRSARFRCAICVADEDGIVFETDGVTEGTLLAVERGDGGFGYDPLFVSTELGQTFAEADPAAKDRVIHRGRALARLAAFLRDLPLET